MFCQCSRAGLKKALVLNYMFRDPGPTLLELVDAHSLPVPYGGELEWKYGMNPTLSTKLKNYSANYPKGPIIFVVMEPPWPTSLGQCTR